MRAFYQAILEPDGASAPVLDRHAFAAREGRKLTDRELKGMFASRLYKERVSEDYVRAAADAGVAIHVFQATVWVVWRRITGSKRG